MHICIYVSLCVCASVCYACIYMHKKFKNGNHMANNKFSCSYTIKKISRAWCTTCPPQPAAALHLFLSRVLAKREVCAFFYYFSWDPKWTHKKKNKWGVSAGSGSPSWALCASGTLSGNSWLYSGLLVPIILVVSIRALSLVFGLVRILNRIWGSGLLPSIDERMPVARSTKTRNEPGIGGPDDGGGIFFFLYWFTWSQIILAKGFGFPELFSRASQRGALSGWIWFFSSPSQTCSQKNRNGHLDSESGLFLCFSLSELHQLYGYRYERASGFQYSLVWTWGPYSHLHNNCWPSDPNYREALEAISGIPPDWVRGEGSTSCRGALSRSTSHGHGHTRSWSRSRIIYLNTSYRKAPPH